MLKIAFPTNEKMSYISPVDSSFEESNYLTILSVKGQNITDVEIIKNPHPHSTIEMIKECKDNSFKVLITKENDELPFSELKENGVSIYTSHEDKTVLNAFSDFVQDKLVKVI